MREGKVVLDITMSLDGFIAGPNDGPENPLGDGGERLHEWVYDLAAFRQPHGLAGGETNNDSEILDEAFNRSGAIICGKRMFDAADGWGDDPPFHKPVFVLTHEDREEVGKEGRNDVHLRDRRNRKCLRASTVGRWEQGCRDRGRGKYCSAIH